MLLNFCDPRLRPEIKCNTISTEGYEVTNLISDSCKGFLAYSCIKPPVHIDITFLCNIRINHILIWPSVGSQKSSGFQLYSRSTNDISTPYTLLSSGFLSPSDAGLLFYPNNIDPAKIDTPANFLKRYIKVSMQHLTMYAHVLRITVCKTEKSVPALGKIEIWGTVSPRCGKDVVASVYTLWTKQQSTFSLPITEYKTGTTSINITGNRQEDKAKFDVPESFLDPITWELMTQPITLPSGKVIDQTTLEKHGQNEAIWGRPLSDPFTGIVFNEHRKPIMATALKSRIDKFLLDHSNLNEIKSIPRLLGHDSTSAIAGDRRITQVPKCVLNKNLLKRTVKDAELDAHKQTMNGYSQQTKRYCHQLPAVVICSKQSSSNSGSKQVTKISSSSKLVHNNSHNHNRDDKSERLVMTDIDSSLDGNVKTLLSNIKRFSAPEKVELHNISSDCKCCNNSILYKLPCKHVICRKVLLSISVNSQCKSCGLFYKLSDIERIHDNILHR
ncbi:RING finger protein 37 [Cataglyphis hispanica]|uniref:RING finger protein 37 n=1 Tax=Cataglyphis hispanica TaxID=1086592 RepID=UPI0021804971|nr:RING finger protein 37 [Cataglyphis hispanica]